MKEVQQQEIERITRLVKSLKRDGPIRQSAQALLNQQVPSEKQISEILKALETPLRYWWNELEAAVWALGCLQPELAARYKVAARLWNVLEWRNPSKNCVERLAWLYAQFVVLGGILAYLCSLIPWNTGSTPIILDLLLCVTINLLPPKIMDGWLHSVQAVAATALGRLGFVESVNALIEAIKGIRKRRWTIGKRRLEDAATDALFRLLPALTQEDYGRLPSQTSLNLYWLVEHTGEPLADLALEALGKVGGGRAVHLVERIAAKGRTAAQRELAQDILPVLKERQQHEEDQKNLLRASEISEAATQVLLRPSGQVQPTEPEKLLRASVQGEGT